MGSCAPKSRRVVWSPARETGLLVYNLDLFVDHLAGKAINRHMHPVMLFPFHDEIVLKARTIGLIVMRLKISGLCRSRTYSITSSSCVPSTSTVPSALRSRPSAM